MLDSALNYCSCYVALIFLLWSAGVLSHPLKNLKCLLLKQMSVKSSPKVPVKTKNRYYTRSLQKERLLKMYNSSGKLSHVKPDARIQPDRKWFGNTRTITQEEIAGFQNNMKKIKEDPFTVVLHRRKLPMSLIEDVDPKKKAMLLNAEPFEKTFGKKSQRNKMLLEHTDLTSMVKSANEELSKYEENKKTREQQMSEKEETGDVSMGQTRRVMGEVYKVIDSSDVIVEVLDARDPLGTRSRRIEEFIAKETPHKHLVFLINKCDLVPRWVVEKAIRRLTRERPTLAYRASTTKCFGLEQLTALIKQFQHLHSERSHTCVGFVGYPNVGKSSVINSLRREVVCPVAPIPGETKVWRYITLTKKIYLIDCPGHVYPDDVSDSERVLRGVTRVTSLKDPEHYIDYILKKVKPEYIMKHYSLSEMWNDSEDLLIKIANVRNRKLKGNRPDIDTVARLIIEDFQRGYLPWFVLVNSKDLPTLEPRKASVKVFQPDLNEITTKLDFGEDDLKQPEMTKEEEEREQQLDEEAQAIIGEAEEILYSEGEDLGDVYEEEEESDE